MAIALPVAKREHLWDRWLSGQDSCGVLMTLLERVDVDPYFEIEDDPGHGIRYAQALSDIGTTEGIKQIVEELLQERE